MDYKNYNYFWLCCLSIKATCLNNVSWVDIEKIEIISKENEAWAKSWVNHKEK